MPELELRRLGLGLGGLAPVFAFVTYLAMAVPVNIPMQVGDEARRHWPAALAAVALVACAAAVMTLLAWRGHDTQRPAVGRAVPAGPWRPAPALLLESTASWAPPLAVLSSVLILTTLVLRWPLWAVTLAALLPWLPVLLREAAWKYAHYGLYSLLFVVGILQAGHLGEHSAQVTQLLMTDGDLNHSHGVFGKLDFETVHFYWDSAIWVTTALLLHTFRRNPWLWPAFGFATLHEMEHVYLYFIYLWDFGFYSKGGLAGIMGSGGVIGSPLARPYLHFVYNLLVTVPMLFALWHQSRRVYPIDGPAAEPAAAPTDPLIVPAS